MPKNATKHATADAEKSPAEIRGERIENRVKAEGFRSLYEMCRERKVDYQLARRARLEGLTPKTTLHTVAELKKLGIYDDVAGAA